MVFSRLSCLLEACAEATENEIKTQVDSLCKLSDLVAVHFITEHQHEGGFQSG